MIIGFCGYSYHTTTYTFPFPHELQTYLFRLQTEGNALVTLDGVTYRVQPGDLLLVPPGQRYELEIDEPASGDYHLFCFGDAVQTWWNSKERQPVQTIAVDAKIISLWQHLTEEVRRPNDEQLPKLIDTLIQALLLLLDRAMSEQQGPKARPPVVTRMLRFIEANLQHNFKLEEVANEANLSVSRTVHLFKEHMHTSIIQYTRRLRLQLAEEQLRYTNHSLEKIAEESGFQSYTYFHRAFKQTYGVAPGVYRTTYRRSVDT